jgi:hypothetical protein
MRSLTIVLSVVIGVIALQPSEAAASGCFLGPFATTDVPSGCQVVIWQQAAVPFEPKLFVKRDGLFIDVTGTVDRQATTLAVEWPEYDCHEVLTSVTTRDEGYDLVRVSIVGGNVGEELYLNQETTPMGRITAPETCIEPVRPVPVCGHLPPTCEQTGDDPDAGGCSTHGGRAGLAFALLALALVRIRRV